MAGVALALILFFYSGNFLHSAGRARAGHGVFGHRWGHKAHEGEGHNKPFLYWCQLLDAQRAVGLLGVLRPCFYAVPALPRWRRPRARRRWRRSAWRAGRALAGVRGPAAAAAPTRWRATLLIAAAGIACGVPRGRLRGGRELAVAPAWELFLLGASEPLVRSFLALGGACLALPAPGDWRVRLLAIYGLGQAGGLQPHPVQDAVVRHLVAWPFFFTAGAALSDLADRARRWPRTGPARKVAGCAWARRRRRGRLGFAGSHASG